MRELAQQVCEACQEGMDPVSAEEQTVLLAKLDGWVIDYEQGNEKLVRTFDFPDFVLALAFANLIGELAEAENHHPQLVVEWGRVDVCWWTHTINGLHLNDFIMAARCDEVVR